MAYIDRCNLCRKWLAPEDLNADHICKGCLDADAVQDQNSDRIQVVEEGCKLGGGPVGGSSQRTERSVARCSDMEPMRDNPRGFDETLAAIRAGVTCDDTALMELADYVEHLETVVAAAQGDVPAIEKLSYAAEKDFELCCKANLGVYLLAAHLGRLLKETPGADNFVTMDLTDKVTDERISVTVGKYGAKTPAQHINELKQRIADLEARQ